MSSDDTSSARASAPQNPFDLWAAWLKRNMGGSEVQGGANPWSWVMPNAIAGQGANTGAKDVNQLFDNDPLLSAVDQMWNANPLHEVMPIDWAEITRALRTLWMREMSDPNRAMQVATDFNMQMWQATTEVWSTAMAQMWGLPVPEQRHQKEAPKGDKRFTAPEWESNPFYQALKRMYLLASDYLLKEADETDGQGDTEEQRRLKFHLRQFVDAMAPTNFLLTNPAALRKVMETGGASLADGTRNLLEDLREGRLSMTDYTAFQPGENLAITPGKVVYRNKLIELIQYEPQTEQTYAVPLLFIPPWINKYYILDMQPKNSLIRYMVEQGFTVFVVSWKNPDASMEDTTFEDYMTLGPLAAADVVREITGSETVNPMGYCIGGALLTMTLAYLAAQDDKRFGPVTFIVALQDYSDVGDTAVFTDEEEVDFIEQQMMERGYLDSRYMSNMFNLLRSNELIWSNVVNNYILGQKPPAFDLLYWNSDGTRMTPTAHSFYLRNTYVENNLIKPGKIVLKGTPIDLRRIANDIYAIGAQSDHIVPWDSAWRVTTHVTNGKVRFVLSSSGHIAGIINPPSKGKGKYWTNDSEEPAQSAEEWFENADKHDGSWWPDWVQWLDPRSGEKVDPPRMGSDKYPLIEDAPGTYVLEK